MKLSSRCLVVVAALIALGSGACAPAQAAEWWFPPRGDYNHNFRFEGVEAKLVARYKLEITRDHARVTGYWYIRAYGHKLAKKDNHVVLSIDLKDGSGYSDGTVFVTGYVRLEFKVWVTRESARLHVNAFLVNRSVLIVDQTVRLDANGHGGNSGSGGSPVPVNNSPMITAEMQGVLGPIDFEANNAFFGHWRNRYTDFARGRTVEALRTQIMRDHVDRAITHMMQSLLGRIDFEANGAHFGHWRNRYTAHARNVSYSSMLGQIRSDHVR